MAPSARPPAAAPKAKPFERTVYNAATPFQCGKCNWTHKVTFASAVIKVCCFCHKQQFKAKMVEFHASTSAAVAKAEPVAAAPKKATNKLTIGHAISNATYSGSDVRRKANGGVSNNASAGSAAAKKVTSGLSYSDTASLHTHLEKLGISSDVISVVKKPQVGAGLYRSRAFKVDIPKHHVCPFTHIEPRLRL